MRHRLIILATVLAVAGSSASSARTPDDHGVNALYSRLSDAVVATDFDKVASIYRPDSVYLGPDRSPIIGGQEIATLFTDGWKATQATGAKLSLQFRLQQRIWHGPNSVTDIGFSKFSFIYDDKAKPSRTRYDKFVTLSERQKDGSWAFRVDIDNRQSQETGAAEYEALKPVGNLKFDR